MLNLSQLQTFVTVAAEGSMTAAADKLFLTQPAVSQQMKNMEDDLGVELIVRGSKQIKMTAQGEILYEHAKKILSLAQSAEVSIKSIGRSSQAPAESILSFNLKLKGFWNLATDSNEPLLSISSIYLSK
jgi:DNA-binding transcriptional LysR family regulator